MRSGVAARGWTAGSCRSEPQASQQGSGFLTWCSTLRRSTLFLILRRVLLLQSIITSRLNAS